SPQDWAAWFPEANDPVVVLLSEGPDGPDGYLRLRYPADGPMIATVDEWVDRSPAALNGFLGYLGFLRGRGYTVRCAPLPGDRPVLEHFGRQRLVRMQPVRAMALRPGLPEFFLPALRYGPGSGRLC